MEKSRRCPGSSNVVPLLTSQIQMAVTIAENYYNIGDAVLTVNHITTLPVIPTKHIVSELKLVLYYKNFSTDRNNISSCEG